MSRKSDNHHWETFLGRRPIEIDAPRIRAAHEGKTILVTGAGGSLGSALSLKIASSGAQLVLLLENCEHNLYQIQLELSRLAYGAPFVSILGDVGDADLLESVLGQYSPQTVYHAAAFKHVPLMEANPLAAIRNNTIATHTLAQAVRKHATDRLIMISTDKAVDPRNIMGVSKRVAELVMLALGNEATRMNCIRLGNVLGSQGSVGLLFLQQIGRGGPVTVTHRDVSRYFLTLDEAVGLIMTCADLDSTNGAWIPAPGAALRILALAEYLIRSSELGQDEIPITFIGLRPGEKMSEQLISKNETLEPGAMSALRRVEGASVPRTAIEQIISELEKILSARDLPRLIATLCRIVPEYQPGPGLLELIQTPPAARDKV
jgi:FlaA1/EpsC-like NDP-sugar epimerase